MQGMIDSINIRGNPSNLMKFAMRWEGTTVIKTHFYSHVGIIVPTLIIVVGCIHAKIWVESGNIIIHFTSSNWQVGKGFGRYGESRQHKIMYKLVQCGLFFWGHHNRLIKDVIKADISVSNVSSEWQNLLFCPAFVRCSSQLSLFFSSNKWKR